MTEILRLFYSFWSLFHSFFGWDQWITTIFIIVYCLIVVFITTFVPQIMKWHAFVFLTFWGTCPITNCKVHSDWIIHFQTTNEWRLNLGVPNYITNELLEWIMYHFDWGKNCAPDQSVNQIFFSQELFLCANGKRAHSRMNPAFNTLIVFLNIFWKS